MKKFILLVLVVFLSGCFSEYGNVFVHITDVQSTNVFFKVSNTNDYDVNVKVELKYSKSSMVRIETNCFIVPAKDEISMNYDCGYEFSDVTAKVNLCK